LLPTDLLAEAKMARRLQNRHAADRHASVADLALHVGAGNAAVERDQKVVEAMTLGFGADSSGDLFHRVRDSFVRARGLPYNAHCRVSGRTRGGRPRATTLFPSVLEGMERGTRSPLPRAGRAGARRRRETMNIEFIEALEEMAKEKGIPREDLYAAIRKGLAAAFVEEHGLDDKDIDVEIDQHSGDITIRGQRIDLAKFGRIATKKAEETIRQEIVQRRREIVHGLFASRVGEVISGSIHRFEGKSVWVNLGDAEAILPEAERIPGERYHAGDRLRAYLVSVEETQGDPRILLSRTRKEFVAALMKLEVPELEEGVLVIRAIAREPGRRSKVAVESLDRNVDPVGTCVGAGGARVRMVTRELSGEKIDLVRWSDDLVQLLKNGLEPASVLSVELDEGTRKAKVVVPDDELSLAIGKGGQNVRLTAKLVGYDIDVTSPSESAAAAAAAAETSV
jgi:N utilization substance protein A